METFSIIKLVLEIIVPCIAIYDRVTNKLEQKDGEKLLQTIRICKR